MKTPGSIFVLHSGGLGELVRTAPLLRAVHREWPNALITLACRAEFDAVRDLLPVRTAPAPIPFDPADYQEPSPDLTGAMHELFMEWKRVEADLFLCAEPRPSWLAGVAASWFRAGRSSAFEAPRETAMLEAMRAELILEPIVFETMPLAIPPLVSWPAPAAARIAASTKLEELGLKERGYVLCAPMGGWPRARFAGALDAARAVKPCPVLFVGQAMTLAEGGGAVRAWEGGISDLQMLAGLIALSAAYLTDSPGIADLGQSFGVAGVCVSGGGPWPEDAPWAANAVAVVHPLPCFGCGWDCAFGEPVCLSAIPAEIVGDALTRVASEPGIRKLDLLPASELRLIGAAGTAYRRARAEVEELREAALRAKRSQTPRPKRGWFGK